MRCDRIVFPVFSDHRPGLRQHHPDRQIGDIAGQHIRGVGDVNSPRLARRQIDRVIPHAIHGNDFKVRTGRNEFSRCTQPAIGGNPPDQRADLCQKGSLVGRVIITLQGKGRLSGT